MAKLTGVFALLALGCGIGGLLYGFNLHEGFGLFLALGVYGFSFLTILSGIIWAMAKAVRNFRRNRG